MSTTSALTWHHNIGENVSTKRPAPNQTSLEQMKTHLEKNTHRGSEKMTIIWSDSGSAAFIVAVRSRK